MSHYTKLLELTLSNIPNSNDIPNDPVAARKKG